MLMRPVEKDTLRSKVAAELFQAIVSGTLQPGERIYEENIAHRLGVAKTTLREALQNLETRGLITKYERRGSFVTKLLPKDIEEAYEVRLLLEPSAAALAHQRMDTAHLTRLRFLLEETRGAGERGDFVRVSERDALFHQLIWTASGNGLLARQLRIVCFPLWAFELIRLFAAPTYSFDTALDEHRALLAVLEKGDSERVRNTFREILVQFRDQDLRNLQALESNPSQRPEKRLTVTSATEIWQAFLEQTQVLAAQQGPS